MEFQLKALTPIWTGGVKEVCDRLHETGIIGSLRWWYEVMVRGLEGYACDPTSTDERNCRCPIETNGQKLWCNVCELFGMTGLRRRFRMEINGGKQVYSQKEKNEYINIRPQERNRGWYLGAGRVDTFNGSPSQASPITLLIKSLTLEEQEIKDTLEVLLYFTSKWAGIGARQQHGYGIFDIFYSNGSSVVLNDEKVNNYFRLITKERTTLRKSENNVTLPTLSQFFFAKILIVNLNSNWRNSIDGKPTNQQDQLNRYNTWHLNHNSTILAASLKNQIRFSHFNAQGQIQDFLFGYVRGNNKQAANICISHAYSNMNNDEVRIWGWIPNNEVKQQLFTALNTPVYWQRATQCISITVKCLEWRELDGKTLGRCTKCCSSGCSDGASFLRCLLL